MRKPRPGLAWSRQRVICRAAYSTWMGSPDWLAYREAWRLTWLDRYGSEPVCAICAGPWTLARGDLHHRSYDRLRQERFEDLIPLHRACHDRLHDVLQTSAWRRMPRTQATDMIVAVLRRSHQEKPVGDE